MPATGEPDLDTLVDRVLRRDQGAFDELFRRLSPRVLGFARGRGSGDPEGLVNDVFVQVFRNLDNFEGNGTQFRSWLFTIARNRMIDQSRSRARRVDEVSLDDTEPTHRHLRVVDDPRLDDPMEPLLAQLACLSDTQREVVLLRVIGELTIEETAAATGLSTAAVKSAFYRATQTLAGELRDSRGPARLRADSDRSPV